MSLAADEVGGAGDEAAFLMRQAHSDCALAAAVQTCRTTPCMRAGRLVWASLVVRCVGEAQVEVSPVVEEGREVDHEPAGVGCWE